MDLKVEPLLSGKELKIAIAHFPTSTLVFRNASGVVTGFGGLLYNELEWLARKLNFSLNIVVKESFLDNLLPNGTWSGMRGLLQREEIDLACAAYTGSNGRDAMELAVYIIGDGYNILEKYPAPERALNGIFQVFSLKVWMGLVVSIFYMVGFLNMVIILKRKRIQPFEKYFKGLNTISDTFISTFSIITNQDSKFHRSDGVAAVTWCLAAFIFVNIYSSCLTAYTSLVFQRPDIVSFQDLASNPRYEVVTMKYTLTERIFLEASSGTMKEVGDKVRRCGDACRITRFDDKFLEDLILAGNRAAVLPSGMCDFYMTMAIVNHNQCRLTVAKETIAFQNMFMGVPKNSPYIKELNQESYWWISFGFANYWKNALRPVSTLCRLKYNNVGESVKFVDQDPIKLEQFYLAFLVLFVGYLLALTQFIREQLTHWNAKC